MEWTRKQVITLIELFREEPVLWDQTKNEVEDKNKKKNGWTEIAEELKINKLEVQIKVREIISQFYKEMKKKKSGPGVGIKCQWFFWLQDEEDLEDNEEVEEFTVQAYQ
ncbi:hypothetical protein AVEN_70840-1 [Araneus ventricosus]|uniref:MADF domain-containing protein n=1 Tax=Araneus ventricosus TaxID=182803 RepID=A0A4Y2HIG4_ARAVE|nr:hypothetical protein AVEN_70840-1 [Araneus ventricosus]